MPLPDEWLQAGCPVGFRLLCHDGEFWGEGPIVAYAEGVCQFSFGAGRMGTIAVIAEPSPIAPFVYGSDGLYLPPTANGYVGVPFNLPVVIGAL